MKNKVKNPLYVVKESHVEEASGILDLLIKKMNLGALVQLLNSLFEMLLENVKNYSGFVILQNFIDFIVQKFEMFRRFSVI